MLTLFMLLCRCWSFGKGYFVLHAYLFDSMEFYRSRRQEPHQKYDISHNAICQLGNHSIRKFAATHTRKCGCTRNKKDIRGRWKSCKRVLDVYDDVELTYPDAKMANKLCIGGPCYYLLPAGSGVHCGTWKKIEKIHYELCSVVQ